jgi:hypothetical protein
MIVRILTVLLICIIILFIGYWIFTGGLSRSISIARGLDNPLNFFFSTTTGGAIRLPGQPDSPIDFIDVTQMEKGPGYRQGGPVTQNQLDVLESQYQELLAQAKDPRNFGNPSPYRNQVTFGISTAQEKSPASEYVTLQAGYGNTAPISLAGWSLQSAVTGVRVALPQAASSFISGILNQTQPVSLAAGGSAIVMTGASPVGISFRENKCSGYLGELQTFVPELPRSCPTGAEELPVNGPNVANFGDVCVDYIQRVPTCHFPGKDPAPAGISTNCLKFVVDRLSYNGCVYAHRVDSNFYSGTWRLYLTSSTQLWRDTHDVVRLLDDQGRTVDVLSY